MLYNLNMSKIKYSVFSVSILFLTLFISPFSASASTTIDADITTNTTWTVANSPYVVTFPITVTQGNTLNIDPGVVVKFDYGTSLTVDGTLKALGTNALPVYLTSLYDDSIGGDTNGDGADSFPDSGDWEVLLIESSTKSTLNNVIQKYSYDGLVLYNGGSVISDTFTSDQGVVTFGSHSTFAHLNTLFLYLYDSSVVSVNGGTIANDNDNPVEIYNNSSLTLSNLTVSSLDETSFYVSDHSLLSLDTVNVNTTGLFVDSLDVFNYSSLIMKKVTIQNVYNVLVVFNSSSATITDSSFSCSNDGLVVFNTSTLNLSNSEVACANDGIVLFSNAKATLDKTKVTGATDAGIIAFGNTDANPITITNSEIYANEYGFLVFNSAISAHQNNIHDNATGAFTFVPVDLDFVNNYWGDPTGPFHSSTNPSALGDIVSDHILYTPWLTSEPTSVNPVIIIPGILGSADKDGVWVVDPIFHVYDDLIDTLKANGYTADKDLFTFAYDWRNSNILTAILLRYKIDEVKKICNCNKVDLVAHSMGGLVARQYIQSDKYQNDVDKMIFMGTPHLGAVEDYLMWGGGEIAPSNFSLLEKFFLYLEARKNSYSGIFDYIHNRPITSVQELLPIYDYLRDKSTGILRTYPTGYPMNTFLENLKTNVNKLLNSSIKITNIVGDDQKNDTISTIRVVKSKDKVLWPDGMPDGWNSSSGDRGLETGIGDLTVPLDSASFINKDLIKINSDHRHIPTSGEGTVYKKLAGKDAKILITNPDKTNGKLLLIKLFSPIDMVVTAPDGKKIGKDFVTGKELNEIDGAFYSGFATDNEYVTIPKPLDGDYKIETIGTGSGGEYTVASGYITDTTLASDDIVGHTAPGQITDITVTIDSAHPTNINAVRQGVTPDQMIDDINRAYDLGWIKKVGVRDSLIDKVEKAIIIEKKIEYLETLEQGKKVKKKIERLQKRFDKILSKNIAKELENKHNKDIMNDQAYNMLKEDIESILNN